MELRGATAADRPSLQALYARCIAEAGWLPPAARLAADFAAVSQGEQVVVAMQAQRLLGFVSVDAAASFIHHLYVDADARGQGVGAALLDALRPGLPLPWRLKCVTANDAALRFYARHGWRDAGAGTSADGDFRVLVFDGG